MSRAFFIFSVTLALLFGGAANAQVFKIGAKAGISTSGISSDDLSIRSTDDLQDLKISLQNSSPEYQLGLFTRLNLAGLYVQPELMFTTSSVEYLLEDFRDGTSDPLYEQYFGLEMPIMAGIKLGPFRANAGPVFRTNLGSVSEITQLSGYGRKFRESQMGIQAGFGFDLGKKLILDFRYEVDLSETRDEITIFDQTHELSKHGGQLSVGLGYSF
ncbi:MAG: PorT family protein [Bacteroidia bacterium]|nr:PorT family protein [Bacteroidia bacterium]